MKIATWNVERLHNKALLGKIIEECNRVNADILILTETDSRVKPDKTYAYETPAPVGMCGIRDYYRSTENRVTIITDYKLTKYYLTYDKYTSICAGLETPHGELLVYGTIMGIWGNRRGSFKEDVAAQTADFKAICESGRHICICGDYNLSFSDNYYYTKYGRETVLSSFADNSIRLLTADRSECIDHIAVSEEFVADADITVDEWNYDKRLSDHKGIYVDLRW